MGQDDGGNVVVGGSDVTDSGRSWRDRREATRRAGIDDLLPRPGASTVAGERLRSLLAALEESLVGPTMSSVHVINPLLDAWATAAAVDAWVARPLERLLTALLHRALTTPAEIRACFDQVRAAEMENRRRPRV